MNSTWRGLYALNAAVQNDAKTERNGDSLVFVTSSFKCLFHITPGVVHLSQPAADLAGTASVVHTLIFRNSKFVVHNLFELISSYY